MNNNEKKVGRIFFESAISNNNIVDLDKGSSKGTVRIKAVLQDADAPNRNNRIYPKNVLEQAINTPFIKEKLKTNSLAGEMNHPPAGSSLQRQMTIDMSNISHFVQEIFWENKLLMGIVETSANRVGTDFARMIENNNMVCSFSMRGGGDVYTKGGYDYIKSPLKIITWDAVHFPSHQKAYMLEKLNENSMVDITVSDLTKYISEQSSNFGVMMESLECFSDNVNLKVEGDKVIISDKTNRPLGYSHLEEQLETEYNNILLDLYK